MVRSFTLGPDRTKVSPVRSGPSPTVRSGQSNYGIQENGYTDNVINLKWLTEVFNLQTKAIANGDTRLLISDGFGTYESAEIQRFCFENNIVLAHLSSHSSHKLQPCDVGLFGLLKIYYREEVERLYRGGSQHIGKPHFTQLYDQARQRAFTPRNIRVGWSKTGHFPWNPDLVLHQLQPPLPPSQSPSQPLVEKGITQVPFMTPKTSDAIGTLRKCIEADGILNTPSKLRIIKLCNAAENAFADRSLLLDKNQLLFEQNCEHNVQKSVQSRIIGTAKVFKLRGSLQS